MFQSTGQDNDAAGPGRQPPPGTGAGYETGLERAFDLSLDVIVGTVARHAFQVCGGDRLEAEDLVQEAVKRLVVKANAGWRCPAGNRVGYLYALVRNLRVESFRSGGRVRIEPLTETAVPDPVPGPEEDVIGRLEAERRHREGRRLMRLVGALRKPEHREIVQLVVLDELTWAEVSRRLDVPESTLRSRMKSATKELRTLMRRAEGTGEPA